MDQQKNQANRNLSLDDDEVIVAQCTPQGAGALALIRLSGGRSFEIADMFCALASKQKIVDVTSHTIHFGFVVDFAGAVIDQVMVSVMHAPRTFTGQQTVEITCHNNQFIIKDIIMLAIKAGARSAREGEFTRRAFLNDKIDLVQAEAINDLIHAKTQQALKKSLAHLSGSFSYWICDLERDLLHTLTKCEACFDFLDEEAEFGPEIKMSLAVVLEKIVRIKKTFDVHEHIRHGFRIAFVGSVNAGKSSLFNNLLGYKRAIVSAHAGTTRDTVEAGLTYGGNHWTLVDTAGIRQTQNSIELEGISRSYEEAQKADVILVVFDGSCVLSPEEDILYKKICVDYQNKIVLVHHKADLAEHPKNFGRASANYTLIKTSASCLESVEGLKSVIDAKIRALFQTLDSPFLLNQRQHALLGVLETKLEHIMTLVEGSFHHELVAHELKLALESITELTGKTISEAAIDAVFKEFCVGK